MEIIYRASDGIDFTTRNECLDHEASIAVETGRFIPDVDGGGIWWYPNLFEGRPTRHSGWEWDDPEDVRALSEGFVCETEREAEELRLGILSYIRQWRSLRAETAFQNTLRM